MLKLITLFILTVLISACVSTQQQAREEQRIIQQENSDETGIEDYQN